MTTLLNPQGNTMNKLLNRVPEITLVFWIIKILATTVGETAADFLAVTLNLGLNVTTYIMGALLVIALINQFRLKRYVPASYWIVVVLTSIVGTLVTDNLVDNLGVSLVTTTIVFSIILIAVFAAWYASEKTLAMKSIDTARRELYYWAAILFTFALGTAAGDLAAEYMGLGYGTSLLVFAALIGLVAIAHYAFKLNGVLAFWIAYILTRPLGASTGDLLAQPVDVGGLGLGTVVTSFIFLAVILGLVIYLSTRQKKPALVLEPA
jgi:uncharacterized membrane-anchored protein